MSVYRPKNSPYYHYDFQHNGQRYYGSTACTSKTDARAVERDKRTEAGTGRKEKPAIDVDQACGTYWETRGRFEGAAETTEYQLANIVRLYGASTLLHDITHLDVSQAIARRRGEPAKNRGGALISNGSVNRETELLRRVCNYYKKTYKVPEIEWGRHRLREEQERVRSLSADEERRLFKAAVAEDPDIADLAEFAELSGARKNAVVTLLWSKLDLAEQWAEVRTKGGVWHRFPLSQRMIEIIANRPKVGPFVFTFLCRQTRKALTDKRGRKHPARVKGQRYPFSKQGWDRRWRKILADAGIEDFRFHDLRHTAGTRITRASNLKVAKELLGHTRIETTARYAHVESDDIRRAMENVEQSRNSPEQRGPALPETRRNARDSA